MREGKRIAFLAVLCAAACALLLAIVYWGSGLKGSWLALSGVLTMTSLVGLFLGLAVSARARHLVSVSSVLVLCIVAMLAFGGWVRPLPNMTLPLQFITEAMPSRWAFEALLSLEMSEHPAPVVPENADANADRDVVEAYFPADSQRMGPAADAIALGSMLIGLAALAVFISGRPWTG